MCGSPYALSLWFRGVSWRVGSTEPGGQPPAQSNGGHAAGNRCAQNPAYRRASHFFLRAQPTKKPAKAGFFVGLQADQPRDGIKLAPSAKTELGAVIFNELLGLANTPRLTAGAGAGSTVTPHGSPQCPALR